MLKCEHIIFLAISLFCFRKTGLAQASVTMPAGLSFQNFTYEDGLSDNLITNIYQDSRGFIWISTPEGLNRFDGSAFKRFYAGKTNSIPSNIVGPICEYKKDHLLVATTNGLVIMNIIDQHTYVPGDSALTSIAPGFFVVVPGFFVENSNKIWLYSSNGLLQIDSSLTIRKFLRNESEIFTQIQAMHRLNDGRLIISSGGEYYFMDEKNNSLTPLQHLIKETGKLGGLLLLSYYDALTNSIFVSFWDKGLHIIDLNKYKIRQVQFQDNITFVTRNSRGNIWIGSKSGLSLLDEKNLQLITYRHHEDENSSLVNSNVTVLFEDRESNLWIGTAGGISKLSHRALSLTQYRNEFALEGSKGEVYDITKGEDGKIYIATFGNGVFSIDPLRRVRNYGKDLIKFAWSVNKDGKNIIVTGHDKKIYRLYTQSGETRLIPILKPYQDTADLVLFAYIDRYGGKWYSANKQMGLFYTRPGEKRLTHFSNRNADANFLHSYFNIAVEDNQERIWFGMNKRPEIVSYHFHNKKFTVHPLNRKMGMSLAGINAILPDTNFIWVATNGTGLIRYDPDLQTTRLFTIEDGLSANNVASLAFDNKHRLWVGTRKGLDCLLPGRQQFINFTRSDGLPEIYFGDGAMYYDSVENRLYAGARETLFHFDPDEFLRSTTDSKSLHIDEILVNGKNISFSSLKELKLPYDQNNLQFVFTAVDFETPASINYYYKLAGADKDWIESGRLHSASYANLTDGSYRFLVKAVKPGIGEEMTMEIPFDIIIQPPYWRTWWFKLAVVLAIISLFFALIRAYYLRQLERLRLAFEKQQAIEQERTRIATDMHDDLGAGLTRIKFITESISEKTHDPVLEPETEKLRFSSNELVDKMGEIIWAMNDKNNTMEDLIFYLRSYAVDYCYENKLACDFQIPETVPQKIVSGQIRRNVFLVLKECLHNVVKHAAATKVSVNIVADDKLSLSISDDGKGFEQNAKNGGNGLLNMRKRAEALRGHLLVSNSSGTTVQLEVPV